MLTLPLTVAAYVAAANAQDPQRLAACFTEDATVRDEQRVHQGRRQIAAWAADTAERYRSTITPLSIDRIDGAQLLRATVHGNFPGSPATLAFRFTLDAQAIASLEITP